LATYSTLSEKYAEAHLKRGVTPSAVYDAKIEKDAPLERRRPARSRSRMRTKAVAGIRFET
jgi:hypothetical protein